mgnify:CR=1 FL=1
MNVKKTNTDEIISISITEKSLEVGEKERSFTKYFGERDISICEGDKIIILGENASGKTRLVKDIHDKISSKIDNTELENFKIEYIGHRVFESFKEIEKENLRALSPREITMNAFDKMIKSLNDKIKKNKSEGIGTVFIFNINTGLTKTHEMGGITSLDATVVHNMIFSHVYRAGKKLFKMHNKIILLRNTEDINVKRVVFEEDISYEGVDESEILSEILYGRAIKDYRSMIRKMRDYKKLSFKLIDIELEMGRDRKVKSEAIRNICSTYSNIISFNVMEIPEKNNNLLEKISIQGYSETDNEVIKQTIVYLTEQIEKNIKIKTRDYDNYKIINQIKLVLLRSNRVLSGNLKELNKSKSKRLSELKTTELILDSKFKALNRQREELLVSEREFMNDLENDKISSEIKNKKEKIAYLHYELQNIEKELTEQRAERKEIEWNNIRKITVDSQNKSKNIETSLALVLNDIDEKNIESTKSVRELALHYSNIFSTSKGKKRNGINVVIRYREALERKDIIGAIFSISDETINLRRSQRTGEIGHVNATIQRHKDEFEARISITSDLDQTENKEIESRLMKIMKINDLKVDVKVDQRIGLKKKIIVVNTVEKFLQYYWNTKNEKHTAIIFSNIINEINRNSLKNILNATDVLIVDCDGRMSGSVMKEILNNCREYGTSIHGHFLFIEIDNKSSNNSLDNHPFNYWRKSLRRNSETSSQALSAGLRDIIRYRHSRNGIISKQDTKRAKSIQVEDIISGYNFLGKNERYEDLEIYDNHNFLCFNSEIIDLIEIILGSENHAQKIFKQKIVKLLEKIDYEMSINEWGEARYSLRKLDQEIKDVDENNVNSFKKIEIYRLLEDLMLLCNYLNNARTNNLFLKEDIEQYKLDIKNIRNFNFYELRKDMGTKRREIRNLISKYDEMNFILPNFFISQLIAIESGELPEILTDSEREKIISSLINRYIEDNTNRDRQKFKFGRVDGLRTVRIMQLRNETIYQKKFSPFIGLNHNQVDFSFNDENNWEPKLEWKISHIKHVASERSIDERNLHLAEFWALLSDGNSVDRVWEMIEVAPKGWMFSILMRLYNSKIIELPNVFSEDIYSVIKKWILEYPWHISDLINVVNLFQYPELNKLYLRELNRIDFDEKKEDYKKIWKADPETEQSLKEWYQSIIKKLEDR